MKIIFIKIEISNIFLINLPQYKKYVKKISCNPQKFLLKQIFYINLFLLSIFYLHLQKKSLILIINIYY